MTAKKTTKTTNPAEIEAGDEAAEIVEVTAADEREAALDKEEMLADMPALRAPVRLRLRHKNGLTRIGLLYRNKLAELGVEADKDGNATVTTDQAMLMLDVAAEIDEWAEGIAEDPKAYELWAEANKDNPEKFLAIMDRYMSAVGE